VRDTRHPANLRAGDANEATHERGRAVGEVGASRDRCRGISTVGAYHNRAARRKLADIRARVARRILLITRATRCMRHKPISSARLSA